MRITDHAPLRYLQRVDPTEAFPGERLRAMYDRARRVRRDGVEGAAYLDDETDALLVVDEMEGEIVTVLNGGPA
ncbi:hypothetical protein NDI54_20990 [Haloarcula sp. S1AR25-5A]|uniref:Uncharacterized protein n=1 Tax=Haloarcula terrestris TaxID=2950533 RepID=A0AAE4F0X1_9EURY|nr:hypothetical protein [Haloarcula terrestris]MDS0223808.1 hypothetical protein [Haloarcula terrestris]